MYPCAFDTYCCYRLKFEGDQQRKERWAAAVGMNSQAAYDTIMYAIDCFYGLSTLGYSVEYVPTSLTCRRSG